QRHLSGCRSYHTVAAADEGGRTVLREKAASLRAQPLPPGLRTRCEALVREHLRDSESHASGRTIDSGVGVPLIRSWRLFPISITAVLTLFLATVVFSLATKQSDTLLAAQLTADHAKCFSLFADAESPVADPARREQMLLDDYGWT